MNSALQCDEELLRRLPLPLAQLYRRAHNAKTPLERHLSAFYLWEASLKLLGCVAVAEYACYPTVDSEIAERLENLARPSLGHWLEFVRCLVPILANRGNESFQEIDQLLSKTRDDLPRATGLDAALREVLTGKRGARSTVRLTELFDRLLAYRNKELGHGAAGQRPSDYYEEMGRTLLGSANEVLARIDLLGGRRLIYLADLRQTGGKWVSQRYELIGESDRLIFPLELPLSETRLPTPERVYLESPEGSGNVAGLCLLHPLLIYDANETEVLFLNARRGRQRTEYLCYTSGRVLDRPDLGGEQRLLLARVLNIPVDEQQVQQFAQKSYASQIATEIPWREDEAEPVRRIGEFELRTTLGRGGMGIVYRAWQPSLGREVALKCLLRTGDTRSEARFNREIRALGRVDHPHLIKIYTSGAEGDRWFYAMELIEGATLSALCDKLAAKSSSVADLDLSTWQDTLSVVYRESREAEKSVSSSSDLTEPSPSDVQVPPEPVVSAFDEMHPAMVGQSFVKHIVKLMADVARAAHALHEAGIIHRDIKPGNIMVSNDGREAVLMDLGLAQLEDSIKGDLSRTREFVGTLRYASPEQVLAVDRLDPRSDVYSLGATLWELITLRPLFGATGRTPSPELMQRIQYEDPEPLSKYHPKIHPDLEAIVAKCLEKNPRRRYATAFGLARDLERFLEDRPVSARPITRLERMWRSIKRRPLEVAFAVVCAIGIAVLAFTVAQWYINSVKQDQARESNARARKALMEIMDQVNSDELRRDPRLNTIRETLGKYLEDFVRLDEAEDVKELAAMSERMADITQLIGRKENARNAYRKAEELYDLLSGQAEAPEKYDYLTRRAAMRVRVAFILIDLNRYQDAEEELNEARRTLESLPADQASQLEALQTRADVFHDLARCNYLGYGEYDKAITLFNQALEVRHQLVKQTPEDAPELPSYRNALARDYGWKGDVEVYLGKWSQAQQTYARSEEIRKQLVKDYSDNPEYKYQLARSYGNPGRLHQEQYQGEPPAGQPHPLEQAIEAFEKSRDLQVQLVRDYPAVTSYVSDLASTCVTLARLQIYLGRGEEAQQNLEEARKHYQRLSKKNPTTSERGLATCAVLSAQLLVTLNPDEARQQIEGAEKYFQTGDEQSLTRSVLYDLALLEAVSAELSPASAVQHKEKALQALAKAREEGFRNGFYIDNDPGFRGLRQEPAFQKLVNELKEARSSP
jgi:serine/threonine protein kinase